VIISKPLGDAGIGGDADMSEDMGEELAWEGEAVS
jgi:hypothetical protein